MGVASTECQVKEKRPWGVVVMNCQGESHTDSPSVASAGGMMDVCAGMMYVCAALANQGWGMGPKRDLIGYGLGML